MKLKLIRTKFYQECTHGALYIDGEYFCDTLEHTALTGLAKGR